MIKYLTILKKLTGPQTFDKIQPYLAERYLEAETEANKEIKSKFSKLINWERVHYLNLEHGIAGLMHEALKSLLLGIALGGSGF